MRVDTIKETVRPSMRLAETYQACQLTHIELPPSCDRPSCRIGFEKLGQSNVIYIDSGISYRGNNEIFRRFVEDGQFIYANDSELNEFLAQLDEVALEHSAEDNNGIVQRTDELDSRTVDCIKDFDEQAFTSAMNSKIMGQDSAIESACSLISSSVRKVHPTRPLSLLLEGETGVGKTLFGDTLAEAINAGTGANYATLRIDMNQLAERYSTSRLYGSPPGYIGYDDPPLFEALLDNPRQVILLDEMEKADPRVMYVLMNAMSSGRMESARIREDGNRVFDFTHSIMVFTTNIPLDIEEGLSQWETTRQCKQKLRNYRARDYHLPPEIVSRFSEVIAFSQISDEVKLEIAQLSIFRLASQFGLQLDETQKNLLQEFSDICISEDGVREYEYMAERFFGRSFADYDKEENRLTVRLEGLLNEPVVTEAGL